MLYSLLILALRIGDMMNIPIMLAILSLFGFGFGSFLWKIAGANQVYGPSWMIVEGLTFALFGVVIHLVQGHSFELSTRMTGLAALGGILAGIAVFSMILAFRLGGDGSVIFPIARLGLAVAVIGGFVVYREPVTVTKLLGLGLGMSSIVVLSR